MKVRGDYKKGLSKLSNKKSFRRGSTWKLMLLSLSKIIILTAVLLLLVLPMLTSVRAQLDDEEDAQENAQSLSATLVVSPVVNVQKSGGVNSDARTEIERSKQVFGEVIAYIKETASGMTEIHTMRVDGSNDQILFNGVIPGGLLYPMLAPKFSRDGSELTFYAWKGQYSQIWRIRSDGTNPRLVFNCEDWIEQFPQGNASFPSFSYDRTKIVFKFDPGPGPAEDAWPIVTYSDGSYFWRVAQGGEYFVYSSTNYRVAGEGGAYGYVGSCIAVTQNDNEYPPGQYPPYDVILYPWQDPYIQWVNWLRPLDWSPDGTKILLRDWAWPVGTASATGYYALGIVDVSTSQVSYVFGVDADGYYNNYNNVILQASFSPDGTKVVFDLSDGLLADGTAGKDFDIYTINADGTGKTKITNDKKSGLPTWGIRRGTIRGYVYTPDGFPIVEADVATGAKATTKTDALGMFALEALPWDNYNITISKPGYLTQTFQVPLSSSITTQNFTLTVTSPGNITGNVYIYGSATPIANATVSTRLGNYTVKTDFTGAFTISSVAPNPYNITANASGYRYQSTSVTVSPGATAICNIYLTPITIANWTYIVYLDGDNNLWQAGDNDYQEMQSVGSTDSVNIVVLKDNDWFGDTKLLVPNIGGATSTEIPLRYVNKSFSIELDMGSYLTLVDFVRWAIDNYPARYYALDLWDHGGGYTGMCWDDISGTHISVPDLKLAMISIATHLGRPIDVVVHDSCLMAELEADYNIKAYADFIVHSEEIVPGDGIPYHSQYDGDILGGLKTHSNWTPEQFAKDIVLQYSIRYAQGNLNADGKQTLSAVNTTLLDDKLALAVNNFAQKLKHIANTYWSQINNSMWYAEFYEFAELIDLYHFASRIKANVGDSAVQQAAQWVMDNISACVIAEWHGSNHSNSHGLTVFFPRSYNAYTERISQYSPLNMTIESKWNDFLQAFYNKQDYPNTEPACAITYPSNNAIICQGAIVTISGTASDSDGISKAQIKIDRGDWVDAIGTTSWSYSWNTAGISEGLHKIYARALDNKTPDIAKDYSWYQCVIVNVIKNQPPVITYWLPLAPSIEIIETDSVAFNITAHDPDTITLTYQWYLNGTPIVGANTNAYTFTTNYDSAGIYNITVMVSDGFLIASRSWTVKVNNKNRAPVLNEIGELIAYEGLLFEFQVSASDPDGESLTFYDNTTLFDINATTGLISFVPDYESNGTYWINITVSDGTDIAYKIFKLIIVNVNRKPISSFSPVVAPTINEGESITFNITAYDPDGTSLIIEWKFDGSVVATGNSYTFTANYTSAGAHTVNATVSDGEDYVYHQWTLTVIELPPTAVTLNEPTTMTTTAITITWSECKEDDFVNYTIYQSATQGAIGNVIKVITDRATTYCTITGLSPNTVYYLTVRIYDSSNLYNDSNQVSGRTLAVNHPPQITSFSPLTDKTINEGESITFNVAVSDPDGTVPTVEWRLNNVLVGTGNSYTLTTNYTSSGIYTVNVTVTDGEYYVYHQWVLAVAEVSIVTPAGGSIPFQTIVLDIPQNAVSANTTITITPISVTPPSGYGTVGSAYRIESAITTFAKPITITLSYTEPLPEGVSEDVLAIWKKEDGSWKKLGGVVDKEKNTVSVEVTSLSEFAIMYEIKKVEVPPAQFPWLLIIGIIAIIVVVVTVIGASIVIKRKRKR